MGGKLAWRWLMFSHCDNLTMAESMCRRPYRCRPNIAATNTLKVKRLSAWWTSERLQKHLQIVTKHTSNSRHFPTPSQHQRHRHKSFARNTTNIINLSKVTGSRILHLCAGRFLGMKIGQESSSHCFQGQPAVFVLKDLLESKTSIQEYRNEIQNSN